jgi:hypothetical protein
MGITPSRLAPDGNNALNHPYTHRDDSRAALAVV